MGVACGGQVAAPDGPDAARRPGDVPDAAGPSCKAGVSAVDISAGRQAALCHGQPCRCVGCLALHGMPVASPPVGPTLTMRLESMTSLSSAAVDTCSVVAFAWLNRGQ